MERVDFFIDWYHKENERTAALNEAISTPTGIVTAISVVYYFLFTEFDYDFKADVALSIVFLLFLVCSLGFWMIVVFQLFKSYNDGIAGHTYKALEFPSKINKYHVELKKYEEEYNEYYAEEGFAVSSSKMYDEYLIEKLSTALDTNIGNNDKKSYHLHLAKTALFGCIAFLVFCMIPFIYKVSTTVKAPQKIEITNIPINPLNKTVMSDKPKDPPKPPTPPPLREIKEDKRPTPPPPPKPSPK